MAEYQYQGVDKSGKKVSGHLAAENEGALRMALRTQGIRPTRIGTKGTGFNADLGALLGGGSNSMPLQSLIVFTRQMHILIGSGIPLVQGLDILLDQSSDRSLKTILTAVREKVTQGSYLWEALALYPNAFPKLYVALIRAGEASGSMDQILKRLSRYLEDTDRIRKLLKSALVYPAVVICVAVLVIIVMMTFVIPKFEEMLTGSGQALPLPTQVVINISHFFANNILYIIGGIMLTSFLTVRFVKTKEGKALLDRLLFTLPLFGEMTKKGGVARFTRTMQTLLSSGVNLIDALDICKSTIDNVVLEEAVSKIRGEVETGKTLGQVIAKIPVFPKMAVQMITVGESTGNLDKMLEKVADFYEAEVEVVVANISKLIEPFIIVFLGGTVAGLMVAMYLPIFKLAGGTD